MISAALGRRLTQQRSRVLVRAWDYRQSRHARGAWYRLRRVLADAETAHVITSDEARTLMTEGYRAEPVDQEIEPPKLLMFADAARVARLASTRRVAVRLTSELLAAPCLALTPFDPQRAEPDSPSRASEGG